MESFLSEGKTVVIGGIERKMRRLGLVDVFAAEKVFRDILARGAIDLRTFMMDLNLGDETMKTLVIMGLAGAQETAMAFIGSLFGMTLAEVQDPEKFPIADLPNVIDAFVSHPDVTAFFSNLARMMTSLGPILATILRTDGATHSGTGSTYSEADTTGATTP